MKTLFPIVLLILLLYNCTPSVKTTDAGKLSLTTHKIIAILPFEVKFDLRKVNQRQFTETDLGKVKQFMSLGLQGYLYHWLQNYSIKHPFRVEIQHCDSTLRMLSENKIRFMDLYSMNRQELAKLLHVDAVLTPQVLFSQPNNEIVSSLFSVPLNPAPFTGFFSGAKLPTQEMSMEILINNSTADTTLWKFESKLQNAETTHYSRKKRKENILYPMFDIIDDMLNSFIQKFPYKK
jgi:hypothetical protein